MTGESWQARQNESYDHLSEEDRILEEKIRIKRDEILKEFQQREIRDQLIQNQMNNSKNWIACKVLAGFAFGFGTIYQGNGFDLFYIGARTVMLWNGFNVTNKIFNVGVTCFVGFISYMQFYAAVDVYKALSLIPQDESIAPQFRKSRIAMFFTSAQERNRIRVIINKIIIIIKNTQRGVRWSWIEKWAKY